MRERGPIARSSLLSWGETERLLLVWLDVVSVLHLHMALAAVVSTAFECAVEMAVEKVGVTHRETLNQESLCA